ncbi:hypothetical protein, partial [Lysinibacillus mangiferihumi]|uniref:hypothetical protein n=2 Tax=Lysinibacillus mangiferihumi TaxID=1130819 RepID=UPI001477806F
VTVAEGQTKAGIPVTFFIPGSANGVKAPVTVEAVTNDEGIATYSYTRYAATNDTVTVYANGDRSKFSTGYVFWAVDQTLTITEVTTGNTINNGANKTYKVTYKHPETGRPVSGKVLNVSVLENIDVTVDKLQNVTVNGINVVQTSDNNTRAAQVTTDSKGEATFTVTGSNAEVTPVVFEATPVQVTNTNGTVTTTGYTQKYTADTLQAVAAKVTFGAIQAAYTIEVTRDGGETAATGYENGRKYKVIVKDKDGKLAANEIVNVAFNEDIDGVISTVTSAQFVKIENGRQVDYDGKKITVRTNAKGEASFVIGSNAVNSYATPIVWIDINNQSGKDANLDKGEPSAVAPISYFQAPYLDGSKLVSYNGTTETDKFVSGETATFKVQLTNQSGKVVQNPSYTTKDVTYTVYNTGANNVKVGNVEIAPNRVYTLVAENGEINVTTVDGQSSSVKVLATGVAKDGNKEFAFTSKEATATFTSSKEVTNLFTGDIHSFDTEKETIVFTDGSVLKDAVKYAGETDKKYEYRNINRAPISKAEFVNILKGAITGVKVTYEVKDNTVIFNVLSVNAGGTKPVDIIGDKTSDATAVTTAKGKVSVAPALATVATTDTAETKLEAVKAQVTKEVNDTSVNVTVVETSTTGTYTVTLSKGSSTATVTVTPKFGQKLTATYITSSIAVNNNAKDLDLTILSTLAGFTIANVNPDVQNALDITTGYNNNVITISKASGGTTNGSSSTVTTVEAADIKGKILKIHFEAQATDYIKEKFTATITIDDRGNRTTKVEVATP